MEKDEIEMLEIIRARPDLLGLALRLIAEATARSASRAPGAPGMPEAG